MRPQRSTRRTRSSLIHTGEGESLAARLVIGADGRQSLSPRGRRHRGQPARPPSVRADLQHQPFPAAQRTSRPSFTPRKGRACSCPCPATAAAWCGSRARGSRAADGARRRRIVGSRGEDSRTPFSAACRSSRAATYFRWRSSGPTSSPAIASRWSANPPMSCRRSARRASTWVCAMPPISPTSQAMRCRSARIRARRTVLARYQSARRADVASRMFAIDIANRSLLSDFSPMQSLRAAGMHLLGAFGPLRRLAMREGLAPTWKRVSWPARRGGSGEPHVQAPISTLHGVVFTICVSNRAPFTETPADRSG